MSDDSDPRPLQDAVRFFAHFLRRPGSVGAVLPSSPQLARVLVGPLELAAGDVVVEYGPGTGAITRRIAEILPDGVRYLGIELEPKFVTRLRARFPKLSFHEGSVADVAEILRDEGLSRPRAIISGLPFASLPGAVRQAVIDATAEVLADGGEFRTFQVRARLVARVGAPVPHGDGVAVRAVPPVEADRAQRAAGLRADLREVLTRSRRHSGGRVRSRSSSSTARSARSRRSTRSARTRSRSSSSSPRQAA